MNYFPPVEAGATAQANIKARPRFFMRHLSDEVETFPLAVVADGGYNAAEHSPSFTKPTTFRISDRNTPVRLAPVATRLLDQ
jgi:hypothetical protein